MRKSLTALVAVIVFMVMLALAYVFGRHDAQRVVRSAPTGAAATTALSDADVLFLEAWQRGYALDDLIVRRQLVRRMRDTLVQEHPVPTPDDATLGAWLAQHADRYQVPARYSFDQVYLSRGQHGAKLRDAAAVIAAQLRVAPGDFQRLGDPFPRGRHVDRFSATQVETDFGGVLARTLASLPQGQWQGPLASSLGLHFIRVTAVEPARVPTLDEVRAHLGIDYLQAQQQQIVRDALLKLHAKFANAPPLPQAAPMQDEDMP
ncbi:MAG TPA: peptidylprolyl isomerase [Solimonas sp.]